MWGQEVQPFLNAEQWSKTLLIEFDWNCSFAGRRWNGDWKLTENKHHITVYLLLKVIPTINFSFTQYCIKNKIFLSLFWIYLCWKCLFMFKRIKSYAIVTIFLFHSFICKHVPFFIISLTNDLNIILCMS